MLEPGKSSRVTNVVLAPEPAHHLNQLFAHLHTGGRGEAQDFKLMFLRRLLRSSVPDTEIDAATGHPVETGELVGKQNGMPEGGKKDRRAQAHPTCAGT